MKNMIPNTPVQSHRALCAVRSLAVLFLFHGATASAALIFHDDFSFASSGDLNNDARWTVNASSASNPQFAAGNLSVAGLAESTGHRIEMGPEQESRLIRSFGTTIASPDHLYYSALLQLDSVSGTGYMMGFRRFSDPNNELAATLWYRPDADTADRFNVGIEHRTTQNNVVWSTQEFSASDTLFVVVRQIVSQPQVGLWINPAPSSFAAAEAPTPDFTASLGSARPNWTDFFIRTGGANHLHGFVDEIRVGTSWAEVTPVPEPAALSLLAGLMTVVWTISRRQLPHRLRSTDRK